MRTMMAIGAVLLAGGAATAQTPAGPTVQQAYEAATALDATGTPVQRLAAWEALEKRITNNRRTRAVVGIRKAVVLIALDRRDEAIVLLRASLAQLPATDPTLAMDRATAYLGLGQVAVDSLDFAGAVAAFAAAETASDDPGLRLTAWIGLYRTQPYVDPDAAAATVARVTPLLGAMSVGKTTLARIARYDAERLMNRGDFRAAKARALDAVKLLGGLTDRTDLEDVSARSDVAIASILSGDFDIARRYMAMTGAGRVPDGAFDPAVQMVAPDCGGDAGLKPQDVAVVEFSVGDDGRVMGAAPVYAAGGGSVGLEFARAALRWSWTPEQLKALPVFYRIRSRVEMRCSAVAERPGIKDYLDTRLIIWLADRGIVVPTAREGSDAAVIAAERAALASAERAHGVDAMAIVPQLLALVRNAVVTREDRNALAKRGLAILVAANAPPLVRLGMARIEWATRNADGAYGKDWTRLLREGLADPVYANDASARIALKVTLADAYRTDPDVAIRLLREVRDDPAAPQDGAMRVAALARLASLEQAAGDIDAARKAFAQTGLDANQCALIDAPPRPIRVSGDYPNEAMGYGFEGWATVQFDVTAQGKTANIRTIVAYPPFVFSKASEQGIRGALFAASFRPGSDLGCGGLSRRYVFRLP